MSIYLVSTLIFYQFIKSNFFNVIIILLFGWISLSFFHSNLEQAKKADSKREKETLENDQNDINIEFQFTLIENQRWHQNHDWGSDLLNSDPVFNWTDLLNRKSLAPDKFKLPSTQIMDFAPPDRLVNLSHNSQMNKKKVCVEWDWVDTDWAIVTQANSKVLDGRVFDAKDKNFNVNQINLNQTTQAWDVDSNGWMYGNYKWEDFSKEINFKKFTRKRAWTRRANFKIKKAL
ncbi:hypothetical protein O181_006904 [Austropuccinia psidii MF-1]|uniref:TECPR1-like DysF domain-containing protein n=1 Tax=Austropuccinia psidii MF-1 TaxID=1389203 RepID=A0A9Q3BK02_9BASI|nr:hypothetical protein [Austropuccinia psidii MF-1]